MTEEKKYPRKRFAPLKTIDSLTKGTRNPVKILCFVVQSQTGAALVQDIFGEQKSMKVSIELESLSESEKYMLIGNVQEEENELRLNVISAYNVDSLDIGLYKEVMKLEDKIYQAISS
ncbi:MAG: hypothetical protein ACTSU3_01215 [Candidatus Thorarchaeota archaeon]